MPGLRNLQETFMTAITSRDDTSFAHHLVETAGERRLNIYRNNLLGNLGGALTSAYPVVTKLVGEAFFSYAAEEYILRTPSRSGDLHRYGENFGDFLQAFPPAASLPYLPDVARLEWLCHRLYFAAEHAPLSLESLSCIPPDRYGELRFILHPACDLFRSPYPVDRIWAVNQDDYQGDLSVALDSGPCYLLVLRRGPLPAPLALPIGDWLFLHALQAGDGLNGACAAALKGDAGFDLGTALHRFVTESILVETLL